jgi:Staphylococcal nuclease homologue
MKLPALAAALALAAVPALAESVRALDGDMLQVDGVTYRLWGIDAPGSGQPCADGQPAGKAATEHLRALIGERHVTCEPRSVDRYGRTVALCRADGRDLGDWAVELPLVLCRRRRPICLLLGRDAALLAAGVTVRLGQRDPTIRSSMVSPPPTSATVSPAPRAQRW